MENFKVRAWDKKNKKIFQVTSYLAFDKNGNIMAIDDRPIAEFELMLYTGEKDHTSLEEISKENKEIYRGDIVKIEFYEWTYSITPINTCFWIVEEYNWNIRIVDIFDWKELCESLSWFNDIECCDRIFVIGNKFENPELLVTIN